MAGRSRGKWGARRSRGAGGSASGYSYFHNHPKPHSRGFFHPGAINPQQHRYNEEFGLMRNPYEHMQWQSLGPGFNGVDRGIYGSHSRKRRSNRGRGSNDVPKRRARGMDSRGRMQKITSRDVGLRHVINDEPKQSFGVQSLLTSDQNARKELLDHQKKFTLEEDSPDDKLIFKKNRSLININEKKDFQKAVCAIISSIKCASDTLSAEAKAEIEIAESQAAAESKNEAECLKDSKKRNLSPQVLVGVIRVGPAQRKVLLKGYMGYGEKLIVIYKDKPTKQMLCRLGSLIEFNMKGPIAENAVVTTDEDSEMIIINLSEHGSLNPIHISLTSPAYLDETEEITERENNQDELLSEDKCRMALARIRRVRWQAKVREELELPVVRIFIDLSNRLDDWRYLTSYAASVLVNKVAEKFTKIAGEGEHTVSRLFMRSLEVLAGGILLPYGSGLKDPCETGSVDIVAHLTPQEAEDLTRAAQLALRMYACGKLKDILNMTDS